MQKLPLTLWNRHFFVGLAEGSFLVDTGAPSSFGRVPAVKLGGETFNLSQSYFGLNADTLSTYVGCETAGILGADILNRFDVLIDVPHTKIWFSEDPLNCAGEQIPLDSLMEVPVVTARINGKSVKMFFDTGAQISYFQGDSLSMFPNEGSMVDFYPGVGQFSTDTFRVPVGLGRTVHELRCGKLPGMLGMALTVAGVDGIVGNQVMLGRTAGYFFRRRLLVLS